MGQLLEEQAEAEAQIRKMEGTLEKLGVPVEGEVAPGRSEFRKAEPKGRSHPYRRQIGAMEAAELSMQTQLHIILEGGIEHVLVTKEIDDPLGTFVAFVGRCIKEPPPEPTPVHNRPGFSVEVTMEKLTPFLRYITKTVALEKPTSIPEFIIFAFERMNEDPRMRRDILMSSM